jgi:hypothetical protein
VPSQKNAKLVRLRGATAVGYWVDRATASAASYATAMRRRATSQWRFCRRKGGLSLRRSLHWPALVEIKDGRRAAAMHRRVSLTQHADTRAKVSPPGPSSSARGARPAIRLPSPTSTAATDAFASAVDIHVACACSRSRPSRTVCRSVGHLSPHCQKPGHCCHAGYRSQSDGRPATDACICRPPPKFTVLTVLDPCQLGTTGSFWGSSGITLDDPGSLGITLIDQLAYIKSGVPARSAKIYALQNARELCFQWRIGENDARTLAYEVAPAAKPPQTTPLYLGTRVDTRG